MRAWYTNAYTLYPHNFLASDHSASLACCKSCRIRTLAKCKNVMKREMPTQSLTGLGIWMFLCLVVVLFVLNMVWKWRMTRANETAASTASHNRVSSSTPVTNPLKCSCVDLKLLIILDCLKTDCQITILNCTMFRDNGGTCVRWTLCLTFGPFV